MTEPRGFVNMRIRTKSWRTPVGRWWNWISSVSLSETVFLIRIDFIWTESFYNIYRVEPTFWSTDRFSFISSLQEFPTVWFLVHSCSRIYTNPLGSIIRWSTDQDIRLPFWCLLLELNLNKNKLHLFLHGSAVLAAHLSDVTWWIMDHAFFIKHSHVLTSLR